MQRIPPPCRSCPVMLRHHCRLQPICACANAWYRTRRDVLLGRFLVFFPKTPDEMKKEIP